LLAAKDKWVLLTVLCFSFCFSDVVVDVDVDDDDDDLRRQQRDTFYYIIILNYIGKQYNFCSMI